MSINTPILITILSCAFTCIATKEYYQAKHQEYIAQVNAQSEKLKQNQLVTELQLRDTIQRLLEESHAKSLEIERRTADLAKYRGRLRDPGARSTTGAAGKKNSGSDNETAAGKLSDQTVEFLLGLTGEADQVREQLRLCQQFVSAISKDVKK